MQGRKLREDEVSPRKSTKMESPSLPLHRACWDLKEREILNCIRDGCDVNEIDGDLAPIHYVLRRSHSSSSANQIFGCINALLEGGANLDIPDARHGRTALFHLFEVSCPHRNTVLQFLLDKGLDVNFSRKADGKTPIALALELNELEVARMLIEAGADVNIMDNERLSPLHTACKLNKKDFIKLFVDAGADVNDDRILSFMESGGVQFQLLTSFITRAINSLTMAAIGMDQLRTSIEAVRSETDSAVLTQIDSLSFDLETLSRTQDELKSRFDKKVSAEDHSVTTTRAQKLDSSLMEVVGENMNLRKEIQSLKLQNKECERHEEALQNKLDKLEKVVLNIMTKINGGEVVLAENSCGETSIEMCSLPCTCTSESLEGCTSSSCVIT